MALRDDDDALDFFFSGDEFAPDDAADAKLEELRDDKDTRARRSSISNFNVNLCKVPGYGNWCMPVPKR